MKSRGIVKKYDLKPEELEAQISQALGDKADQDVSAIYEGSVRNFDVDTIHTGRIVDVINDDVVVDVGYKSEGIISIHEFDDPSEIDVGDDVDVLLEAVEDESGSIVLSKRKADRIRGWERIINTHAEGDVVKGRVTRKIKGGLLVDIGVPVFLPASQVSIRRTGDISEFIGQEIEAKIIKIDESRMNIVVSRRKLIEEERERLKRRLMEEIEEGQVRKGVVKNIADFGAFVDLGGIDGLLHITDMSWGRVGHPSEVVAIDSEIEIKILKVDRERERIALGLKQLLPSPWDDVELKYPVGSRVTGEVVNVMSYGAFVKIEDGLEGLVHISEMSWTKRVSHPSEIVNIGDHVEVVVLDINKDKREISLGMKQAEVNPWLLVEEKYPSGTVIEGKVRNLTNYGAFVEIEEGIDGLLHISDMSWTKKVAHPSEVVKKGDSVRAVVLSVDQEKKRVALGVKQLEEDPWRAGIPDRFLAGTEVIGTVTKLTNFGVFVELEQDLEGLLHISELSGSKVGSPEEIVQVGQKIEVRILRVDPDERKIGLTMIRVLPPEESPELVAAEAAAEAEAEAVAEEPASTETTVDEVVAEEAVAEDAVVEDAVAEEPVAEEPVAEEPVAEESVAEEPVAEEPVVEEAVAEEPVVEDPVVEEAVAEEPVVEDPVVEEPVAEEPVAEEPAAEDPVAEEPVAEEPAAEEPVVDDPVVEEPVVEEPVVDDPIVEEPAPEEPVVDDPIVEEPAPEAESEKKE